MMQLLTDTGLNIFFDPEALRVSFVDTEDARLQRPEYSVRTFEKLAPILEEPGCIEGQEQEIIYWMFRNLGLQGNEHLVKVHSARYDLSVFRQHLFGQELMKTSGHYHPSIWQGGSSYPEVYEVAYGSAVFLMQEVADIEAGPEEVRVRNCIALRCEQGQKAIMPPDFGHVTINPDPHTPLVTTNWVCSDFASVYGGAERCGGFAWRRTEDRGWVENPRYRCDVPKLRMARCRDVPELGLRRGVGIYGVGCEHPELLAHVKRPHDFIDLLWSGIEFEEAEDREWLEQYLDEFKRKHVKR